MSEIQSHSHLRFLNVSHNIDFRCSDVECEGSLVALRERSKCFEALRWLYLLVRQKGSWSPASNAIELWRFLINIGRYREIRRLLKLRPFDEIAQNNPGFAFKYVVPNYLARSFTVTERVSCFLHHYRRIHAAFSENALRRILRGDVVLHEISNSVNCFAITMGLPEPRGHLEGELSLDLRVDGKKVFNLSFTIVPGWVLKSEAAETLLISRIQGTKGSRAQIRLAQKAFHEFFLGKLLLSALQGVADALGICEVHAKCAATQASYEKRCPQILKSGYDDFFAQVGMVETAAGFYSSPIPIEGKPLASIKRRGRSRARKRREMRQQIQCACAAFLLGAADRAAHSTSCPVTPTPAQGAFEALPSRTSCPKTDYNLTP
jgi:uncharacterized protein VirK/YbjX